MRKVLWCSALFLNALLFLSCPVHAQSPDASAGYAMDADVLSGPSGGDGKITGTPADPGADSVVAKLKRALERPAVTPRSFVLPASLIGAGVACLVIKDLKDVNEFSRNTLYRNGFEDRLKVDNYTMVAPAVAVYALNLAGIKGQHNLRDRTMILGISSLVCNGLVFSTKHLAGVSRPDQSDYFSFPSGHTAYAFATAEFMRQEYRNVSPWYGAAGYACAIGTGLLRMYHDKHWFNDVVTGAGVGILSTRFAYWIYPKISKAVFRGASGRTLVAPSYNNGAYGLSLVHSF